MYCSGSSVSYMSDRRKITVIGRAEIFVPVDTVTFDVGICRTSTARNECLGQATDESNQIIKMLNDIGISKDKIKLKNPIVRYTNKKVSKTTEGVTEETIVRNGVEAELHIIITASLMNFSQIYEKLCTREVSITTAYSNSESERYKSELLRMIGEDAHNKATALAESVNAKIDEIIEISFTGGYRDTIHSARMMCCNANETVDFQADPEDIRVSEEAEFVWTLI